MKVFFSVLLVLITFQAYAIAPFAQEFRQTIDEFHYQMTVEWDQKDLSKKEQYTQNFLVRIKELRKKGMTLNDIKEVLSQMNPRDFQVSELGTFLTLNRITNEEELVRFVTNETSKSYNAGASWNGEIILSSVPFIIAALFLTAWVYYFVKAVNEPGSPDRICLEWSTVETCSESCSSCDSDNDPYCYGGYNCSTTCGYDCSKYQ